MIAWVTTCINVVALQRDLKGKIQSDTTDSHHLVHLKPKGECADGTFVDPGDADSYLFARSELGSAHIKLAMYEALEQQRNDAARSHSRAARW